MTDQTAAPRVSRAPQGTNSSTFLSLRPEERYRIERLAKRDERSISATARLLLLRGLQDAEARPDQSLAS